jgi:hypothetical protein
VDEVWQPRPHLRASFTHWTLLVLLCVGGGRGLANPVAALACKPHLAHATGTQTLFLVVDISIDGASLLH